MSGPLAGSCSRAIAAQAYDWDIQKQLRARAAEARIYPGYFAWHYPPPFLFVATLLAQFPYAVAFIGWVLGRASCPISP